MKMNKMLLAGTIGFAMLAGPAHADSWFKPNPYSYDKLVGNWYADITKDLGDGATMRLCLTEQILVNGTSRVQGQVIITTPEAEKTYGQLVGASLDSTNKLEVIGDKIIRTTAAVNNKLTHLYVISAGSVVTITEEMVPAYNEEVARITGILDDMDRVNQVQQGTIVLLNKTHLLETDDNDFRIEAVKINNVITECN